MFITFPQKQISTFTLIPVPNNLRKINYAFLKSLDKTTSCHVYATILEFRMLMYLK